MQEFLIKRLEAIENLNAFIVENYNKLKVPNMDTYVFINLILGVIGKHIRSQCLIDMVQGQLHMNSALSYLHVHPERNFFVRGLEKMSNLEFISAHILFECGAYIGDKQACAGLANLYFEGLTGTSPNTSLAYSIFEKVQVPHLAYAKLLVFHGELQRARDMAHVLMKQIYTDKGESRSILNVIDATEGLLSLSCC